MIRARHARGADRRRRRCSRRSRVPRGRRVAVVTNAGGLGILARRRVRGGRASSCRRSSEATHAALAELMPSEASLANPVDMLGGATAESFERRCRSVLADPAFDAVIVLFVPPVAATDEEAVGAAISRGAATRGRTSRCSARSSARRARPPACRASSSRRRSRIPSRLRGARPRGRARRVAAPPGGNAAGARRRDRDAAAAVVREALADGDDAWLDAAQTRALLEAYGVPLVAERSRRRADDGGRGGPRARLPGRRQDRRAGRAQDRDRAALPSTSATRTAVRAAAERIGGPVLVQPMRPRRRRAARRRRAGPGLRPARRVRARAASSPS